MDYGWPVLNYWKTRIYLCVLYYRWIDTFLGHQWVMMTFYHNQEKGSQKEGVLLRLWYKKRETSFARYTRYCSLFTVHQWGYWMAAVLLFNSAANQSPGHCSAHIFPRPLILIRLLRDLHSLALPDPHKRKLVGIYSLMELSFFSSPSSLAARSANTFLPRMQRCFLFYSFHSAAISCQFFLSQNGEEKRPG